MKFGNVSTLLLTLSPWYESYAVVVVGENVVAPRSNHVLPEISDNSIKISPTVAPSQRTATTARCATATAPPSKHFKLIHNANNRQRTPEVHVTGSGRRKKVKKITGNNIDRTYQRIQYPAEPFLYIGDVTTATSSTAPTTQGSSDNSTSAPTDETKRPMVAVASEADSGRAAYSSTDSQLERRLLDNTEYNLTTAATLTSWEAVNETSTINATLSYAWNLNATVLDDFQMGSDLTTVIASTAQTGSDQGFEFGDTAARSAALALLLALFCAFTVFGNVLVMAAVARERYLHTVTNYFVVSLATADCLVGALVMPFSVIHETMSRVWIFGRDWCDVWHSLDVLGSTASILNLCVISLDRYWAITDPITYPSKMTTRRAVILIAVVWVCSSLISFPAIAWWRAVSPTLVTTITTLRESTEWSPTTFPSSSDSDTAWPHASFYSSAAAAARSPSSVGGPACIFTEDIGYLVFSSIISFYGPLTVMVFTYYRIYRAAAEQTRSLRLGTKQVLACNGEESMELTLRIHRGGGGGSGGGGAGCSTPSHVNGSGGGRRGYHPSSPLCSGGQDYLQHERVSGGGDSTSSCSSSVRVVHTNLKHFSFSRKLARMAKEQKAAKTLGIVMGVFVLCWMPFFVCNVLLGLCSERCFRDPALASSVVTWLGWINSGMNPVIYACWSRDFRRAFTKILCGCCPRLMALDGGVAGGHRTMRHRLRSRVCQSSSTPLSSTCSAECVRL